MFGWKCHEHPLKLCITNEWSRGSVTTLQIFSNKVICNFCTMRCCCVFLKICIKSRLFGKVRIFDKLICNQYIKLLLINMNMFWSTWPNFSMSGMVKFSVENQYFAYRALASGMLNVHVCLYMYTWTVISLPSLNTWLQGIEENQCHIAFSWLMLVTVTLSMIITGHTLFLLSWVNPTPTRVLCMQFTGTWNS